MESLTSLPIGPYFQKGLQDEIILYKLMNKLQPVSVSRINHSKQNQDQLENLSSFNKATVSHV